MDEQTTAEELARLTLGEDCDQKFSMTLLRH